MRALRRTGLLALSLALAPGLAARASAEDAVLKPLPLPAPTPCTTNACPVPPPTPTACPAPAAAPSAVQTAAPKVIIEVPPPNVIIRAAGGCGEKECFLKQICNWGCKQHVCHPHYTFQMAPVDSATLRQRQTDMGNEVTDATLSRVVDTESRCQPHAWRRVGLPKKRAPSGKPGETPTSAPWCGR